MKKNNWYVLTGAPSSGKTTILKELEKKGHKVIYEIARIFIENELKKGKSLKEIRKNELVFQQKILKLKVDLEKKLPKNKITFLERGIPDSISYFKICDHFHDELLNKAVKNCFYKKIFLLELLEYKKDHARVESRKKAQELETLLELDYKKLGMDVINVPKMSIEKRVRFILDNL
jgi:predicted ATPase